jgi:hypothetical protein
MLSTMWRYPYGPKYLTAETTSHPGTKYDIRISELMQSSTKIIVCDTAKTL